MTRRCAHCFEPIEQFNSYDYALRGPTWRHEKTREIYCRITAAEPMPQACPTCRCYEPDHAPTCLHALAQLEGITSREGGDLNA